MTNIGVKEFMKAPLNFGVRFDQKYFSTQVLYEYQNVIPESK